MLQRWSLQTTFQLPYCRHGELRIPHGYSETVIKGKLTLLCSCLSQVGERPYMINRDTELPPPIHFRGNPRGRSYLEQLLHMRNTTLRRRGAGFRDPHAHKSGSVGGTVGCDSTHRVAVIGPARGLIMLIWAGEACWRRSFRNPEQVFQVGMKERPEFLSDKEENTPPTPSSVSNMQRPSS